MKYSYSGIENPCVGGSIPPQATIYINELGQPVRVGLFLFGKQDPELGLAPSLLDALLAKGSIPAAA